MSEAHLGKKNPMYGKTSPNKGKTTSKEIREKIRKSLTGKKASEATKKKMRAKIISEETRKKLKMIANTPERIQLQREIRENQPPMPSSDSKIAIQTRKILTDAGIKFKKEVKIKFENRYNTADIVIGSNKIIEVNGYYHFDPRIHPAEKNFTYRKKIIKPTEVWAEEKEKLIKIRELSNKILM